MTSFLEKIPNIYERFNETTTQNAIDHMQKILKRIIKRQDLDITDYDLINIQNTMNFSTMCDEGLINEDFDATPENEHLFGVEAVYYLFWKLIHSADEDTTGCNARQLLNIFQQRPAIIKSALKGVCFDKETVDKHKELEKDGKYMQDCYATILQNLKNSLPEA